MIASWKISIERSLFHNVLLGYNVQIDIQGSTSLSSSIINLPNIALVDNEAEENRYLDKLRDKCQILFYNDFIFSTDVCPTGEDLNNIERRRESYFHQSYIKFPFDTSSRSRHTRYSFSKDQAIIPGILLPAISRNSGLDISQIDNTPYFNVEFRDVNESALRIRLSARPKNLSDVDTQEKEHDFVRKLSLFIYNNIVVHFVEAINSIDTTRYEEPVIEGKLYSREAILSTIDDPFSYTTNIVINKKDQPKFKGNLDYTRKIRVNKISEGEYHEESSAGNED